MTEHVISHRKPRRKRGGARRLALRRAGRAFGALVVTLGALTTASLIAPYIYRSPATLPAAEPPLPPRPVKDAALAVVKVVAFGAPAPAPQRTGPRPRRRSVPLDALPAATGEDFEVLTAAELDAISQARN